MTQTLDLNLAQDLPVEPPPPPSHETILHGVIAEQEREIETIRAELPAAAAKVREIDDRRQKLDFALSKAEQKLSILAGTSTQYRDSQRAEALAKILTGDTSVKLDELPQEDPADRLTPADIREGISQLRKDRSELGFAWNSATAAIKGLRKRYYKATALLNGARYLLARGALFDAWSKVRASECAMQEHSVHHTPTFVSLAEWDTLALPGIGSMEELHALRRPGTRFGPGGISGETLRLTGRGETETAALKGEFESIVNLAGGQK